MVGRTISHYRILKEIGRGGMGVVYKAKDIDLGRPVALKFLPRHLNADQSAKKRFIHEAKTASALDHPNVGYIHEIGETDEGQLFIAMAFYSGESIEEKLKRGSLSAEKALDYAIQTAEGLKRAHATGIVHRDIKPGNLMVTEHGVVKILDFGIAKMTAQTQLTKTGASVGTVLYMSPEQARGEEVDHRADIWALGVVLYEMLAGIRPFNSEYEPAVVYSILNENPEFITKIKPETPVALERVIERALTKKVEQRYQTIDEMLATFRDIEIDLLTGQAKTKSIGLGRKQRLILLRAVAGIVVLVFASGIYWWTLDKDPVSIAILPLRYETPDTTQNYFVDGIHEGLIGDFIKISGLRVRGRSSVLQFRDGGIPIQEIARILQADYIVEGSVSRDGEMVSITATLLDANDDYVWREEFPGEIRDIRIIQAKIAQEVARQTGVELTPKEQQRFANARAVNPTAQEAYFLGLHHAKKYTKIDLEEALRWFEIAKEEDPEYALAYAGIASTWGRIMQMGFVSRTEVLSKMTEADEKALELDSTLVEVHQRQAAFKTWGEWDWVGGGRAYRKTIATDPNRAGPRASYSHYLIHMGRIKEGLEQAERAIELDPISVNVRSLNGWAHLMAGQIDEAVARFQTVLETQPNSMMALDGLWDSYSLKKMYVEALDYSRALYEVMEEPTVVEAFDKGFEENGYAGAMLASANLLADRADSVYSPAYDVARFYINAERYPEALEWLEKGVDERDPNMPYVMQPLWDPIRDEPRFKEVSRRVGLPE